MAINNDKSTNLADIDIYIYSGSAGCFFLVSGILITLPFTCNMALNFTSSA